MLNEKNALSGIQKKRVENPNSNDLSKTSAIALLNHFRMSVINLILKSHYVKLNLRELLLRILFMSLSQNVAYTNLNLVFLT